MAAIDMRMGASLSQEPKCELLQFAMMVIIKGGEDADDMSI